MHASPDRCHLHVADQQSLTLCLIWCTCRTAAVAGMALWFTSQYCKSSHWLAFENVTLEGDRMLRLGSCQVPATISKRKLGARSRATVVAHPDCSIWEMPVVWG